MPVGSHQVPLDTAKNWAKRLAKTSKTLSPTDPWALSKCQLAVAQMLGYKHWHDMEAGLNSGTTDTLASGVLQANTAYPTNYQGCIPETPEQWQQFWANAVSSVHRTHFYIEFRAQSLSISRHILGRILPYLTLPREVLKDALGPIFDQQMIEGLVRENLTGLVTGHVYIRGINPTSTRYNFFPVYPGGWDIAIELPAKEATPSLGLGNMGLPKEVVGAIQKIATRRVGAFLFSGSMGTGRASLMRAVIDDLHGNLLPDEHEVPHAKAIPVIGSKVDNNHLTLRKSSIAKIYAITQKHERLPHTTQHQTNGTEKADREAFAACMRQDPDVFVIDEIVTSTKAAMLREATERGVLALATVVSSPHNVLDRMADFDQQDSDDNAGGVEEFD